MELVVFVGIPASGKSTESEKYRAKGYRIVSSDEIRSTIMQGASLADVSKAEQNRINGLVFDTVYTKTEEALKHGQSVVVDATHLIRRFRVEFLQYFQNYPCIKKCVLFLTPFETCLQRNRRRTGPALVPEDVMHRMLAGFECPAYAEGWDVIVPVTSEETYPLNAKKNRAVCDTADSPCAAMYRKLTEKCSGRTLSPEDFREILRQLDLTI